MVQEIYRPVSFLNIQGNENTSQHIPRIHLLNIR